MKNSRPNHQDPSLRKQLRKILSEETPTVPGTARMTYLEDMTPEEIKGWGLDKPTVHYHFSLLGRPPKPSPAGTPRPPQPHASQSSLQGIWEASIADSMAKSASMAQSQKLRQFRQNSSGPAQAGDGR
jgi:hypothetical protein